MSSLRLVFTERLGDTPISSICFDGTSADQVFVMADSFGSAAELWLDSELCSTLLGAGSVRELQGWTIMTDRSATRSEVQREAVVAIDA